MIMTMLFCGRFSISEAVLSIGVGDILFSTGSLLVHMTEALLFLPNESVISHTQKNNSSFTPQTLKVLPEMSEETKKNAKSILCWVYICLNFINILMAIVLCQAVIKESILKCISYLVITPSLILLSYCVFLYNLLMLGFDPTYHYALTMYPFYYFYKFLALSVIYKFLQEIRTSPSARRRRNKAEYEQIDSFSSSTMNLIQEEDLGEMKNLPKRFEISPELLTLDHQTSLGFDEHHSIIKGVLKSGEFIPVALKTLKITTPTIPYSKRLMQEAHLLTFLGESEHILKFLGVCVKPNLKDKLFLITEYYAKGDLSEFLKDCVNTYGGNTFKNLLDKDDHVIIPFSRSKVNSLPIFDTLDMLSWSLQIASGMEFLHSKRIIHGQFQAKSVILISCSTIKIWGLSFATKLRHLGNNNTIKREGLPNRFPWRWSAQECLTSSETIRFTTRTDVWSFAVTLWEIFSLGEVPYGNWDSDIVRGLVSGVRLDKPQFCSQQLYEIMNACWRQDPLDRPNFYLLKLFFQQFLSSLQERK